MQEEEGRTRQSIEADKINKKTSFWLQIHKKKKKISNRKIAEQCSIKHHFKGWMAERCPPCQEVQEEGSNYIHGDSIWR